MDPSANQNIASKVEGAMTSLLGYFQDGAGLWPGRRRSLLTVEGFN